MSKLVNRLRFLWLRIRRAISPVYMVLLCASFLLWYILKLQYTYTTNFSVLVNVDGERLRVPCVVEGKGTNLLGYRVYARKELKIPLSDLKYSVEYDRGDSGELLGSWYSLDPQSVQSAISVRFSDIKVISIGDIPSLTFPEHIEAQSE
jgi:hypothetical protein